MWTALSKWMFDQMPLTSIYNVGLGGHLCELEDRRSMRRRRLAQHGSPAIGYSRSWPWKGSVCRLNWLTLVSYSLLKLTEAAAYIDTLVGLCHGKVQCVERIG